jgi:hypothetical protein
MDPTIQVNELDPIQLTSLDVSLESGSMDRCQSGSRLIQVNDPINLESNIGQTSSDREYELAVTGRYDTRFIQDDLENMFRKEQLAGRNEWGRKCLMGFITGAMIMYFLAITNDRNVMGPLHYTIVPCSCFMGMVMMRILTKVKTELAYQRMWCLTSTAMICTIAVNTLIWNNNYNPDLQAILRTTQSPDPVSLFHLGTDTAHAYTALIYSYHTPIINTPCAHILTPHTNHIP